MKKSSNENYKKAIEHGKEWMRKSLDPVHDYTHAQNVEDVGLKVYQELKERGYPGIDRINEDLLRVVVWWHDCYKATLDDFSIEANFKEGEESAKIVRKELDDLLSEEELEMTAEAIKGHAGLDLAPYFFLNRPLSVLHKILIEADAYDIIDIPRLDRRQGQFDTLIQILWVIIDLLESLSLPLYLRTKTTRKDLSQRIWRYWGAWLWNEKYLLKAFRAYVNKL